MYQTKQIHYKAIFKSYGQSETVEYKAKGILHKDKQTHLTFDTENETIHIIYDENRIELKHGNSSLCFQFDKETWNQYQLPYGSVRLKTKLLKFEADDECLKMKYELYDQESLISTVYVYVTMLPYHFSE